MLAELLKSPFYEDRIKYPSINEMLSRAPAPLSKEVQFNPRKGRNETEKIRAAMSVINHERQTHHNKKRLDGMLLGDRELPTLPLSVMTVDTMPWYNLDAPFNTMGCGYLLLAQLTGTNPFEIRAFLKPFIKQFFPEEAKKKISHGTPSELMMMFLNMFDIYMFPVSLRDIKSADTSTLAARPLTKNHVVLSSRHWTKTQLTWAIDFHGKFYHITTVEEADPLDAYCFPIMDVYVLFCERWKFNEGNHLDFVLNGGW